jgi:osmotically-inducible protein OsmY
MNKLATLILLATLFLQGCIFAVGAAAGAAGIAVVYDNRKLDTINSDRDMTNEIIDKINAIPDINNNSHVNVTSFNSVVLLTGEAVTPEWRQKVDAAARSEPGVTKLYNVIEIRGSVSTLADASDSWITAKIKTQMLTMKDMESSSVKVVTANGTVYLMGIVDKDQANAAVDIARDVSGVQKVVKIFQYTHK